MSLATTPAPGPLDNNFIRLGLLLLPFYLYCLWRYTAWTFPWLPGLLRPVTRLGRRVIRNLWLQFWSKPVREHGVGMTLWCWWCLATLIIGLHSLLGIGHHIARTSGLRAASITAADISTASPSSTNVHSYSCANCQAGILNRSLAM